MNSTEAEPLPFFDPSFVVAFAITVAAGLSTALGSTIVFFGTTANYKLLAIGMSFSAGVMIYVSFMEIFQKSTEAYKSWFGNIGVSNPDPFAQLCSTISFFVGMLFTSCIDWFVHYLYRVANTEAPCHTSPQLAEQSEIREEEVDLTQDVFVPLGNEQTVLEMKETLTDEKHAKELLGTAIITALAITLHNFPEGLATFVALTSSLGAGVPLAFAIAIHNIPEGMAVALPIYYLTKSKWKAFLIGSATGLTETIGAVVGWVIIYYTQGDLSDSVYAIMFGLVAGMMTYISFKELIPTSFAYYKSVVPTSLFCGMLVMAISLVLFQFQG
jgi:zinc transporter, ZIP family